MTKQEEYMQGQKASGIEVGDTVRATRHFVENEDGSNAIESKAGHKGAFVDEKAIGVVSEVCHSCIWINCGEKYWGNWSFPYFALQIVTKADGTVPGKTVTNNGDSNMKTQEIFSVAVTENEHVRDGETGLIESTTLKVLYAKPVLPAFTKENAHTQAVVATVKANPNADINWAQVEVKVSSPF